MLAIAAMAITTVGCASTNTTTDTKAAASDDAVNIATIGGMLAGSVTGFLHTKFKIPDLLAGILTQFGLYSINLRIMGKANFGLLNQTTLNAIAGVFDVDQGQVFIDGVDVTKEPEYKRAQYIGRVFQDPLLGTAGDMWIEENLAFALRRGKRRSFRWGISNQERAALDPKTAQKVLDITNKLVTENHLTALMVTHNIKDATGEEKQKLQVSDLLEKFNQASGGTFANDRMMLAR